MKILLFIICIMLSLALFSQKFYVGPAFGFQIENYIGINKLSDSIVSEADGSWSMQNFYSIFLEYQATKLINLKSTINLTNNYPGFLVYNRLDTSIFAPVKKGTVLGATNLNLTISPELRMPLRFPINIFFYVGLRTNINFKSKIEDISFRNGTRHQGLAEVINNMDETLKQVYFNLILGLKLEWRRIVLYAALDRNLGRSITNDITIYGQQYAFINRINTLTVTVGYKLFRFGKPEDQLRRP